MSFYDVNVSYAETLVLQQDLQQRYPAYQWEIKNQVYMHSHSPNTLPYQMREMLLANIQSVAQPLQQD